MFEGQRHFRGFHILIQVDHITAFAARLTEQHPCDRIQQGRFARAVMTRDAGEIKGVEIKFNGVAIGKKT